jgi:hypothetical protein
MNPFFVFNLQATLGIILASIVSIKYVWPKLKTLPKESALFPLLLVSSMRYLGTIFFVANLDHGISAQFATATGYGDLISGVIALIAIFFFLMKSKLGTSFAWIYAIVGPLDLMYGIYLATVLSIYSTLGVSWLVMVVAAPVQIVTMTMLWKTLLRKV